MPTNKERALNGERFSFSATDNYPSLSILYTQDEFKEPYLCKGMNFHACIKKITKDRVYWFTTTVNKRIKASFSFSEIYFK